MAFPRTINEKAARVIGAGVAVTLVVALATGAWWLAVPVAYGYWVRLLGTARLSPLARLANDVVAPRLGPPKPVSGPPKRFAQAMGAGFSTGGTLAFALGAPTAGAVLLGMLVVAATLEAVFALCLGCKIFALLMRAGLVPEEVCAECSDIWSRMPRPAVAEPPARS
jgi:hypothetical protein